MWIMTMIRTVFQRIFLRAYRLAAFQAEDRSAVRQRSRPAERQARLLARSTRPVDRGPGQLRYPGHPRRSVEWMAWSARRFLDRGSCANRCAAALHISD